MSTTIRYLTAGESHGRSLVAILEGIPSGLALDKSSINGELERRQKGYGRGARMSIERDRVEILSGVRWGNTIGSPITLTIQNRDWLNWQQEMSPDLASGAADYVPVTRPRPGHADLVGGMKYGRSDLRDILERASARETAVRVAVGGVCKQLLAVFGIELYSHVIQIGQQAGQCSVEDVPGRYPLVEDSDLRCADTEAEVRMKRLVDEARSQGDTLGGVFELVATGLPPGLGSHVQWDLKLDARCTFALSSIQAIVGVEIGLGFEAARRPGSQVQDEIAYESERSFYRLTNRAGGIEGGMSTGEPVVFRCAMKPISTLGRPLRSVDVATKEPCLAQRERSDICAVPAASIVGEAVLAIELARAMREKFGGDSLAEMKENHASYMSAVRRW